MICFVCFCCVQALYTHLRFFESWFCAENSSGFERVSSYSFYLLQRDAAGPISMFKIVLSRMIHISNAKWKSIRSHNNENCNGNTEACEKNLFLFCRLVVKILKCPGILIAWRNSAQITVFKYCHGSSWFVCCILCGRDATEYWIVDIVLFLVLISLTDSGKKNGGSYFSFLVSFRAILSSMTKSIALGSYVSSI